MAFKVFLDANVCIDFLLQRKGFEPSEAIIDRIVSNKLKGYVTPAIVHIISYYLAKVHNRATVKTLLLNLLADVRVIECDHELVLYAINSHFTDIEDALQYYTAMHHKMDYFISLDKNLAKSAMPMLPVVTPHEFITETE